MRQVCCECGRAMERCVCREHLSRRKQKPRHSTKQKTSNTPEWHYQLVSTAYADNHELEVMG